MFHSHISSMIYIHWSISNILSYKYQIKKCILWLRQNSSNLSDLFGWLFVIWKLYWYPDVIFVKCLCSSTTIDERIILHCHYGLCKLSNGYNHLNQIHFNLSQVSTIFKYNILTYNIWPKVNERVENVETPSLKMKFYNTYILSFSL